ncbi:hypothetical protein [Streptomyces albidoflavus]|uniref:hypothetical protein n=1 Tax=Streptomyces albidoflavus TaxID=1886 RepID=UPI0033F86EF7
MDEFIDTISRFPTVVFTAALAVVLVFWVLVLIGVTDADGFEADADLGGLGLGGVPVTVAVSVYVTTGWLASLTGGVLVGRTDTTGVAHAALVFLVLAAALLAAWGLTRLLLRPLRTLFPDEPGPSRLDFVGSTCTIRTGRVDGRFGQAEVVAEDGSTAIVQVRTSDPDPALSSGRTGLLYAYDVAGEFFWVAPFDAALDPRIRP